MKHPLEEKLTLIKEIKYNFANVPNIIGKVYEVNDSAVQDYKFCWDINFYNRIDGEAGPNQPGTATMYAHTQIDAETKLELYAMRFEHAIDWSVNSSFA
ncbi:hypothetical protein [Flavobacterium johnsoniae]|uniref:Uncharacterized protein n=1 Tax=Flavobacterium johnsoniae (strain ATCC 17061 / DSM 2064 / JCM 8514 / BCRC 14874 / CCUG 350202 / NBRC 14942 / NCIMB 11054 / UW101) TaxID=376686 RepID=A5FHI2_FLAJ1|nr:hypothetical protein [Flavobacterium johnsoniae]ABQ05330.1 hypothetical protein Fjoh_2303 [Flavobacterium johnsoniae UW101]OXE95027.1 hypothetical protein B0A63_25850 [Flavobacterium johnsoniae UW101]WQG82867.1 hypothetical protein SR927_07025 [Flavobacterium johnsoniae UW101]SHL59584.1 hypothetical protein SAMN05444146_4173 [Flavobacterium johnsoniae]